MLWVLGIQKCTWSHTLPSHGGFCVVSDYALVGCYCCLQNRAMQVPGPTHLMKIKWNSFSLCWNICVEKPSQAREGGAPGLASHALQAAGICAFCAFWTWGKQDDNAYTDQECLTQWNPPSGSSMDAAIEQQWWKNSNEPNKSHQIHKDPYHSLKTWWMC